MPALGPSIPVYQYYPDAPPFVVGELSHGLVVTIEVWKANRSVVLTSNVCEEAGDTGSYIFSTDNLPRLQQTREQYHWRMSAGAETDEGDFILESIDLGVMPSLFDRDSYIVKPN